jgi:type I restriction enzyme S subunit
MSDEVDFDMETVEEDELEELGAGGASNSEERPRSWSKESEEAGTEGSDKRSEEVRKGRLSDLQGASVSPSKSEKGTELINGVLWSKVGSIPDGWEFVNLGPEVSIQTGYNAPSKNFIEEGGIPLIRNRDLGSEETEIQYDGDYGEEYLIEDGDLLVSMDGEFEPHLWTGGKALLNQRVCKIEGSDRYSHIFLAYAIEKPLYLLQKSIAGTTVKHLSKSNIRSVNLPTPPLPEQRKIASVLYAVDQAIQKTEAVIEQARRVKRGLMQDVLVGGIDSADQIRDPEQEPERFQETALGKIPKEWEMVPLREACHEIVDSPHSTPDYSQEGVLIVRTSDIEEGRFVPNEAKRVTEKDYQERVSRLEPKPGDVVFTREAPVGEAFKIPEGTRLCLGQRTMAFRLKESVLSPDFLVQSIYSYRIQKRFDQLVVGTTNPHLNVGTIRNFKVPVPSLEEQEKIVAVLNLIDKQVSEGHERADRLRKLKKGLMQDLLTGEVRTADEEIDVLDEVVEHG